VVIRVKQHLAALVCVGDTIVMNTLRYADEIRDAGELKIPESGSKSATISDKELKMAVALVEGMSEDWHPEEYHDTYREDVLALVEKKIAANETKTITMPGKEERPAAASNVIDLVALLQASLGKKPDKAAAADEGEEEEQAPPPKARKSPAKPAAKASAKSAANEDKPPLKRAAAAKSSSAAKATAPAPSKPPARRKKAA
jgi:DNA end-binding protein Ku